MLLLYQGVLSRTERSGGIDHQWFDDGIIVKHNLIINIAKFE